MIGTHFLLFIAPGGLVSDLFEFFEFLFSFSGDGDYTLVLGGEVNIDILTVFSQQSELLAFMSSYGFSNVITHPTHHACELNSVRFIYHEH